MARFEHKLPAILEPVGDICVNVTIPAHPDYVALFIRAVRMLETNRLYERDENLSAKTVVNQWRQRTITPLIEALASGTGMCDASGDGCLAYPPFASFISYSPQNPYTDPDLVPEGYEQPPFFVVGRDGSPDLPNYENGDVILDFGSINIEPSWDLEKSPRIELCLEGSGTAKIHFLNIVQGGMAIISVDNPVDLGDIIGGILGDGIDSIDLNQDIVSLPPETTEEIIIEVEVPTEGEHTVYIYFLPTVNDSLIPLAFGGGIRSIELCGNLRPCGTPPPPPPPPLEGVTELKPEFQFTAECGFEYRLKDQNDEIVQDWTPIAGWDENAFLCFGGGDVATKQDIKEALIEWTKDTALKIVSGATSGFEIDEDGNVIIGDPDDPTGETPDDDPLTLVNENLAAKMGAAISVSEAIELYLAKIDTYYGPVNGSPVNNEATAEAGLKLYFPVNEIALEAALTAYYAYRVSNNRILFSTTEAMQNYLFCKGIGKSGWNRWLVDQSAYASGKLDVVSQLTNALSDEFWTEYYNAGLPLLSTQYLDATCVPIDYQELLAIVFNTARNSTVVKRQHRMLFTAEGYAQDTDGDIQDAFWYRTAAGVLTYAPMTLNHSASNILPSQTEVPYRADHKYTWTSDTITIDNAAISVTINRNAGMNLTGLTYPVPFKVTIKDLGEFAL